jgi:atlastin
LPLSGFSWSSGSRQDTSGIAIWNDVFLHTDSSTGDKLAIVIIDTQGLLNADADLVHNSRMFALSSLISSIQVVNINEAVYDDQSHYFQFAVEFARLASRDNRDTRESFECLVLLVRDFVNNKGHSYGFTGGKVYLEEFLSRPHAVEKSKTIGQGITGTFDELLCALLPQPGMTGMSLKNLKICFN